MLMMMMMMQHNTDNKPEYAYDKTLQPDPPGVLNVYRRYNQAPGN